jgi:hypothetical protein
MPYSFNNILESATRLFDFAIAPRYPDAFDDLTLVDALNAQKDALEIKEFILKNFFD